MQDNFLAYPQGPIQSVSGTPLAAAIHLQSCPALSSLFLLLECAFHPEVISRLQDYDLTKFEALN